MKTVVTKLENLGIMPRPVLPLTLMYSCVTTVCSGYLYLYSAWAPQLVHKLQLSPTDAGVLTVMLSVGSAICGIPTGVVIDKWGTEVAVAIGGLLTIAAYLTLNYCYSNDVSNMWLLATAVGASGCASIIGNYSAMKCATTNFPTHKGAATGVVASGFAISALVLSAVASHFFYNNVSGLLMFLALFNGTIIFLGAFFVREIHPEPTYTPLDAHQLSPPAEDAELHSIADPWDSRVYHGGSSLVTSPGRTENYMAVSDQPLRSSKDGLDDADSHDGSVHHRNPVSSVSVSKLPTSPVWETINSKVAKWQANSLIVKIFTSKLFLLTALSLTFLTSIGQTYIFSVGYIVQTQYLNKNYSYDRSQTELQNIQVSTFSLCNFIGRFASGYLSDLLVKKLKLQRLWILILSVFLLLSAQLLLVRLNNLNHLFIVSILSGIAFGIVFGTYPTIVSDYYGSKVYSTVWGTITTGPFFSNTLLTHFFSSEIERHGEFSDQLQQYVCYRGVECYNNTFYLTQVFCLCALFCLLYTIWYKKTVLKESMFA